MKAISLLTLAVVSIVAAATLAAHDKPAAMKRGAIVYKEYCQTCHQATGLGLGVVFPPVAKSDYLKSTPVAKIIKEVVNGKSGKIKVNGKEYNGVMAPMPAKYSAEDVASVLTYVYNSFGNSGGVVTAAAVRKAVPKRK